MRWSAQLAQVTGGLALCGTIASLGSRNGIPAAICAVVGGGGLNDKEKSMKTLRYCVENFWAAIQQEAPQSELEKLEDEVARATEWARFAGATNAEVFEAQREVVV